MRVNYMRVTLDQEHAQLHLEPESDRDRDELDKLISDELTSGCGYDPETGRVIHAQITL